MILLAATMLVFTSWFVFYLRRQLRRYAPAAAAYQKVPLMGGAQGNGAGGENRTNMDAKFLPTSCRG